MLKQAKSTHQGPKPALTTSVYLQPVGETDLMLLPLDTTGDNNALATIERLTILH